MSLFGKLLPVRRTEVGWGELKGVIYRDFTLSYPVTVLSCVEDRPEDALPILKYWVKAQGWRRRVVEGETADGSFVCDLLPEDAAVLGSPALIGWLKAKESVIGVAAVGPRDAATELASVRSVDGQWTLCLTVRRPDPALDEGDAVLVDSNRGEICIIQRRARSWSEDMRGWCGFGRCKRGMFLDAARGSLMVKEKRLAVLFLLASYFQLVEGPFNTYSSCS